MSIISTIVFSSPLQLQSPVFITHQRFPFGVGRHRRYHHAHSMDA